MRFKITILLKVFFILSIMLPIMTSSNVEELDGIVATKFNAEISLDNGIIDLAWENVTKQIHPDPIGGSIQFAVNETHLFGLIIADISEAWISLEFDADDSGCMFSGHDGWVFYNDGTKLISKDVTFDGLIKPSDDAINNIDVEYVYTDTKVKIEIVRKWDTECLGDYVLANNSLVILSFASASDHYGARKLYYLQPCFTIDDVPIDFDPPIILQTDWIAIKKTVLFVALGFSGFFIAVHFLFRNIIRPLEHGCRIVDDDFEPLHIKQRWDIFRGREPRIRED